MFERFGLLPRAGVTAFYLIAQPADPAALRTEHSQTYQQEQNTLQNGQKEAYEPEPEASHADNDLGHSPNRVRRFLRLCILRQLIVHY